MSKYYNNSNKLVVSKMKDKPGDTAIKEFFVLMFYQTCISFW